MCGNANHSSSNRINAHNGTNDTQTGDFTLPWVVNSDGGSCIEDCGGVACPVCTQSRALALPSINSSSFMFGCTLLQRSDGPFADCHSFIDPEPFSHSCVSNLCISKAASSVCKILTAYTNICQRIGARVQNWRTIAKCGEFL